MEVVPCLLFCGIKVALCELDRHLYGALMAIAAYVRTRSAGILMGLAPWHTDFGTKSSVLHLVRGVQAPGTHVRRKMAKFHYIGVFFHGGVWYTRLNPVNWNF